MGPDRDERTEHGARPPDLRRRLHFAHSGRRAKRQITAWPHTYSKSMHRGSNNGSRNHARPYHRHTPNRYLRGPCKPSCCHMEHQNRSTCDGQICPLDSKVSPLIYLFIEGKNTVIKHSVLACVWYIIEHQSPPNIDSLMTNLQKQAWAFHAQTHSSVINHTRGSHPIKHRQHPHPGPCGRRCPSCRCGDLYSRHLCPPSPSYRLPTFAYLPQHCPALD